MTPRLRLPRTMSIGLAIAVVGGAIDVGYHLVAHSPGTGHGPVAFAGHAVTLAGMVVTMIGLLSVAFRRSAEATPLKQRRAR